MARGWESKAVAEQLASAESDHADSVKPRLTPEDAERQRSCSLLQAARARTLQQLQCATNPRYRKLLEDELASLDAQIRKASVRE